MNMSTLPTRRLSRAVLIGTSDFEYDDRLSPLPAVRQNLTDLLNTLTDSNVGILDWEQCSLIDTPDSPASFMGRLQKAADQAEDLLLVYYAGHGIRHAKRDDLYLTVRQTNPDRLEGTGVPFEWVRDVIQHSSARTRLLVLDCCYSGMALGSMSSGIVDVRDVEISGTAVITSSPKNKISHSPPGERLTAFTGELVSLLNNGSRVPGEPLTVRTLYRGLVTAMANRQLPQPKMKADDLSADLLLRRSLVTEETSATQPVIPESAQHPRSHQSSPADDSSDPDLHSWRAVDGEQKQELAEPVKPDALKTQRARETPTPVLVAFSIGRVVLWTILALFVSYTIGGIVGYFFGTPSKGSSSTRDLELALGTVTVAALCVCVVWSNVLRKRRKGHTITIFGDLQDALAVTLMRLPSSVLVILAGFFIIFAAVGTITAGTLAPGQGTMSSLAISFTVVLWMLQIAAGCIYALVWRRRH